MANLLDVFPVEMLGNDVVAETLLPAIGGDDLEVQQLVSSVPITDGHNRNP
uniref:Uncharacterized protein n=1 Tax=Arundo donax TaxID=35708 RepID=A0A0A9AS97_ARUDO